MLKAQPFEIVTTLDASAISGLLCSAFEGGSNYWYEIVRYEFPDGISIDDFREGGKFADPETYWHPAQLIPLQEGCSVVITDIEDPREEWRLDRQAIAFGLMTMQREETWHWECVGTSEEDSVTGDVFLQCCLFGRQVYG